MPKENKNGKALSEEKLDKVSGGGLSRSKLGQQWAWSGLPRDLLDDSYRICKYKNKSSDKKS